MPIEICNSSGVSSAALQPIAIYPNPATGAFTVQLPAADVDAIVTVTDLSGRVLKEVRPTGNATQVQVSVSDLASGTYMVKVSTRSIVAIQKIVLW